MSDASSKDCILKVSGLTKSFGSFTAVDSLSFGVNRGEVFGFLGPNGAGKTTTINMIAGLLKPDSGDITINGVSINSSEARLRGAIGICPQNIVVWEGLTCIEQLEFMGQMYDVDRKTSRKRGLELLEAMGLYEKRNKLAKTLSGGMQRRLNIILALVHDPEILILDEPQAGLDPQSRVLVRDYIRRISNKTTVILTTHDMDEAERLSDRVAIIDSGRLLVMDSPDNLKNNIGFGEILELTAVCDGKKITAEISEYLGDKAKTVEYKDGILRLTSPETVELVPSIIEIMKKNGIRIEDMKIRRKTLEDVFIALTGKGLRE